MKGPRPGDRGGLGRAHTRAGILPLPRFMDTLATPAAVASLIARNLVPAVGVLFLGWSAGNLLVVYYLDTILSAAVVMLLIARHITGPGRPGRRGRPLAGPVDTSV